VGETGCTPGTTAACGVCPGGTQTCTQSCTPGPCLCPSKRVFATSGTFAGADIGGLAGADAICQRLATDAGLGGTYRAWLSDASTGPATTMSQSPFPYAMVNGDHIAESWADLVDGTLARPIGLDERGRPAPDTNANFICQGGEVWTNTTPAGLPASNQDCSGWRSSSGLATSNAGNIKLTSSRLPLFCFEQ
jgi:hypothetical protein